MPTIKANGSAAGLRFALVVSKYHDFVTDRLQDGALSALSGAGVEAGEVIIIRVPGAFEIPLAAHHAAATGVPMAFGVLTTNSVEEAVARAGEGASNKGYEAAVAAIEMAEIVGQLTRPKT